MILFIARNELRRLFISPLAWTILAIVLFILAFLFLTLTENFLTELQPQLAGRQDAPGVTDAIVAPLLLWAGIVMLAVTPLLSMRLLAEERQHGSLTLLTSAPLSFTELVLGKYLGLISFLMIMLALVALMPVSLAVGTSLDWGKLLAGMLGLLLLLASFAAAGLFFSSLTATPLIAAVSSFGFLLLLVVLYLSGTSEGASSELFKHVSHFTHFVPFLSGLFDTADLAYYLLFIVAFLVLAIRHLDNQRLQR
jgi:ABC-2 type transport system permease protein